MAEDWPDWPFRRDCMADLARYVDETRAAGLIPSDCRGRWSGIEAGEARTRQLYDALRDRRIVYANEAWNPNSVATGRESVYQRVRGPAEAIQGTATCLDLALLFAGFAIAADIRPLIGIRMTPMPHALVALDVSRPLSEQHRDSRGASPPGFIADPDVPGIYHLAADRISSAWAVPRRGWVVVDAFQAARPRSSLGVLAAIGAEFDIAAQDGTEKLRDGQRLPHHEWIMADVHRLRADRAPYPPPTGRAIPAIHGYLPARPAFTSYPTRQSLLQDLHQSAFGQQPVTVVLHGESGLGKSMLAHRVAVAADHGCGWFLNASDTKALTRSLAQAERQEQSLRDEQANPAMATEKPDYGEDKALAAAALARLREADRPWVVVLDNCDSAPDTAGLQELIPQPTQPGQVVIITTTDPCWAVVARERGWIKKELAGLGSEDLRLLHLPEWAESAADGKPLIAQALAVLRPDAGKQRECSDGARLVWDLLREEPAVPPEAVAAARLLAWCPPEPVDVAGLLEITGFPPGTGVGKPLADRQFVTSTLPDAQIGATVPDARAAVPEVGPAIQMHRLFAAAVRKQTWEEDETLAAAIVQRLITHRRGRQLFIDAADSAALNLLEGTSGDVIRAAPVLADEQRAGLLWHGLGHIRERRGPVETSDKHFQRALDLLDHDSSRFEVAECLIGRARLVFQRKPRDTALLVKARQDTEDAQELLAEMSEPDERQMREQANALSWLIEQVIAGREEDARKRQELLLRTREELWRSYEKRLALAREGGPGHLAADRSTQPAPTDGLGAERAYYNLAGVDIQLARTHRELAGPAGDVSACQAELLDQVRADLAEAARVYAVTRALRERRYGGRPHPHLASCLHGQALIAYFQAALLGETGQLADAFEFESIAMEQRLKVAGSLNGPGNPAAFRDTDVRKSADFMMKMSVSSIAVRYADPDEALENVTRIFRDAVGEWFDALQAITG